MLRSRSSFALLAIVAQGGCMATLEPAATRRPPAQSSSVSTEEEATDHTADPVSDAPALEVTAVDHIGLAVTDLPASQKFFVQGLGFSVRGEDPSYPAVFLSNGHGMVTLWQIGEPETATPFDRKQNVGLHHLALAVSSFEALDALHTRLKDMPGVRIEFSPELAYGGPAKHMMVYEPSGNRIELVHRPKAPS